MSTARVEVPQQSAVPHIERLSGLLQVVPLRLHLVRDDVLDHGLGAPVRVGGADGAVLGNGYHVGEARGVAVDGGRGREDDVGHIVPGHGAQEADAAADIDAVVLEGDLARLADGLATITSGQRGEMGGRACLAPCSAYPWLAIEAPRGAVELTLRAAKWITLSMSGWAAKILSRAASSVTSAS